jgi:hypothetical protein
VPHPGQLGTLALWWCVAAGILRATRRFMPNLPLPGQTVPKPQPQPSQPGVHPVHPPVNPDPKAHPIHPAIPTQPIHEGGDPSTPVTGDDRIR